MVILDIDGASMLALGVSSVAIMDSFTIECIIMIRNEQLAAIVKQFGDLEAAVIIVVQECSKIWGQIFFDLVILRQLGILTHQLC